MRRVKKLARAARMPVSPLFTWPNLVTVTRVAAAPAFVFCCHRAAAVGTPTARWSAVLLFVAIVSSDVLDGWLARRFRCTSVFGRFLDHGADIFFILFALGWFAAWGWVTWWLPAAIAWAFGLYAFDSWWRSSGPGRQRRLLGSRLGHVGGILNYAAVGGVMAQPALGLSLVPRPLGQAALVAVMGVAFVSGLERLLLLWLGRGLQGLSQKT
jgi:phosphatidylglycerophosphate synthase